MTKVNFMPHIHTTLQSFKYMTDKGLHIHSKHAMLEVTGIHAVIITCELTKVYQQAKKYINRQNAQVKSNIFHSPSSRT